MSTLTTINATDLITDSRAVINANFLALNNEKLETSLLSTDSTLGGASASDLKIASQKAVKAYIDAIAQPSGVTGTQIQFLGSGTPSGYLPNDGSAVSRATYAALFTAISTTYGAGNGSTTFNVPKANGSLFAYDSSTVQATAGSPNTMTLTTVKANTNVFVYFDCGAGATALSITLDGIEMQRLGWGIDAAAYLYSVYTSPCFTAGAHTITISGTSTGFIVGGAIAYSQMSPNAVTFEAAKATASSTSLALSIGTSYDINLIFASNDSATGVAPTFTNGTVRATQQTGGDGSIVLGELTSGQSSTTVTFGASANVMGFIITARVGIGQNNYFIKT